MEALAAQAFWEVMRLDLLGRLLLAAVLGGAIGLEREVSGKPAGFRTNLLICVGAALLTELSRSISAGQGYNADPGRIAAQIVSGIGFLGAGTILQARGHILGLTTAATLWVVAAIGMATGAGAYVEAVGTTILVIAALLVLRRVETHLLRRGGAYTLQVTLASDSDSIKELENTLTSAGLDVIGFDVEWGVDAITASVQATGSDASWTRAMNQVLTWPGVRKVTRT